MSKFERHDHQSADIKPLPVDVAGELAELSEQIAPLKEALPIARGPLTESDVRTILMSLLLAMFLAALDQTIVATAAYFGV